MSFANYGEWEVDHICPVASFDFQDEKQIYKCLIILIYNHYGNRKTDRNLIKLLLKSLILMIVNGMTTEGS